MSDALTALQLSPQLTSFPHRRESLAHQKKSNDTILTVMEAKKTFNIAGYLISPDEQVVYCPQMIGGTDYAPDGSILGHWDGHEYVPCMDIDFKTTNLYFMGSNILFKELFQITTVDVSSMRVLHHSIGYSYNYTSILSPIENRVYWLYDSWVSASIDISGYTHIRQIIFKNGKGKLFFLTVRDLRAITIPVDEATLQHVFYNYYTDKNGLYWFDDWNNCLQLESSHGKPVQPVFFDRYLVYGDAAYPYGTPSGRDKTQKDLRLNANELRLIKTNYGQYLGDNDKLLDLPPSFTNTSIRFISPADIIQQGTPEEPVSEWESFDIITVGGNLKGNTVYYSSKKTYAGGGRYYCLIKTSSGIYGVTGSSIRLEAVKFDNEMIFNIEKDDYEPIEVGRFRRLTSYIYIYKNQMYGYNSIPVETDIDMLKLQAICLNGKATEFFTDGTYLVGGYHFGRMKVELKGTQEWYKFEEPLFRDVDWESLQIVNEKVMVDKNNIYQVEDGFLKITPIKDLGLEVKVIPLM